jgi:Pyruvate/2-oxoacid:ferredoxin oxidoreductase delta subunit
MEAIKVIDNAISVSDQCLGCGICAAKCPQKAIEIEMISPQKESIQDYFHGFRPDV